MPVIIGAQISGDVLHNPGLGYAMAMGMVLIMTVALICSTRSSSGARALAPIEAHDATRIVWWLVFILGAVYFLLPLYATLDLLARAKPPFAAYTNSFADPKFFSSLFYSFVVGVVTIIGSLALIVPTAYWVRLRVPRARPVVEFVTLMPFVIPPVVLVFGLIRVYSRPPLPLTHTDIGSTCCSRSAMSCCRSRTCSGPSTRACARSTSGR